MNKIPKCTLVPSRYFDEKAPRCFLSEICTLSDDAVVEHINVPQLDAVFVYEKEGENVPRLLNLLLNFSSIKEYNKVYADLKDGVLSLVIAQGEKLLLANVFPANSFTTAEYYILASMKSLQLNPEVSTIYFDGAMSEEDEMSLYTYFNSVEKI